ncbi:DUF2130 domain-containing protein [Mycoplasmopsis agalactiae]|uniref:CDSF n=2 Tax=Bacteria TaxID=2 RepID=D3VQW5_MYCAA|nr:DUF2130 domain-containing protein [Mycoplasmopsis agalactiae]KAB6718624.1 DUF2130 domain-containing protein [Mycoplasmopsis agalactiae]CAJ32619.1 CDSF [Mycoplasmopsis agalactiae]CBH40531.1 CDSF [Mycoplasmopsis agalactiae]CBH40712.1 CDSF [Mycoplasmopsis agalactiae]CBH40896.1 CDSF [Mycoplasmopsis agalactiae]
MTIKFIVKDKKTIELLEDAKKGDLIDLSSAETVDLSIINKAIDEAKDNLYNEKIATLKKLLFTEYKRKLTEEISAIKDRLFETINAQKDKITKLETQISNFEENHKLDTIVKVAEAIEGKNNEINRLNDKVKDLAHKINLLEVEHKNEISNKVIEANKLNEQIKKLNREKLTKNVKVLGEELENYCINEFNNVSSYAFRTSVFEKDNTAIKAEGEFKGSKGDFIFKVYAEEERKTPLLGVMCEMKTELESSVYKQKNQDHYKKLDSDREKKQLDYALLVSELEYQNSDWLVYRVPEYKNMFVVRPMYFITMLGILETIALKYKEITLDKQFKEISFSEKQKILDDFKDFKDSILDTTLKYIETKVSEINKSAENIKKEAHKILEGTEVIIDRHLNAIKNKINSFSIGSRVIKPIEKLASK